jgi:hypothetical protein
MIPYRGPGFNLPKEISVEFKALWVYDNNQNRGDDAQRAVSVPQKGEKYHG